MRCVFCQGPTLNGRDICEQPKCRIQLELACYKDLIVQELRNPVSTLLIYLAWITLHSLRRGTIFTPSPLYFRSKTNPKLCDFERIVPAIEKIFDGLDKMRKDYANDAALCRGIGEDAYCLVKFILISQLHKLQLLMDEGQMRIYKILTHPTKENQFRAQNPTGQTLLFHGSATENWHSILRNGIKNCSGTVMMTSGAVSGNGVYLAGGCETSYGYCNFGQSMTDGKFPNGSMFPRILGVVQLANYTDAHRAEGNVYVVNDDSKIILRYIIVYYETTPADISKALHSLGIHPG